MSEDTPDPRSTEDGICHEIVFGGDGIEWVCIRKKHDTDHRAYRDEPEPAKQHYFVNRWPYRKKDCGG